MNGGGWATGNSNDWGCWQIGMVGGQGKGMGKLKGQGGWKGTGKRKTGLWQGWMCVEGGKRWLSVALVPPISCSPSWPWCAYPGPLGYAPAQIQGDSSDLPSVKKKRYSEFEEFFMTQSSPTGCRVSPIGAAALALDNLHWIGLWGNLRKEENAYMALKNLSSFTLSVFRAWRCSYRLFNTECSQM